MKESISRLAPAILIVSGLALWGGGVSALSAKKEIQSDRNPLAIQKSAYGKLLARLSENTINRVWHLGVEISVPHSHDGDDHGSGKACNAPACSSAPNHDDDADEEFIFHVDEDAEDHDNEEHGHDHSGHDHDSDNQPVEEAEEEFVYHVGQENKSEEAPLCTDSHCGNDHCDTHGTDPDVASADSDEDDLDGHHCLVCKAAAEAAAGYDPDPDDGFLTQAKGYLQHFSGIKYLRTNPKGLSKRHTMMVKKDVEEMLLRSYRMDPTHFGAYNSYHLFLTTHDFGGTDASRQHAKLIGEVTLAHCRQETEDPEPWLTGAAAAMNLYLLEMDALSLDTAKPPLEMLQKWEAIIGDCIANFDRLQKAALENGVWDNLSTERQLEIAQRATFTTRTFTQFDAMIARAESRQNGLAPSNIDSEVAEMILEAEGE